MILLKQKLDFGKGNDFSFKRLWVNFRTVCGKETNVKIDSQS